MTTATALTSSPQIMHQPFHFASRAERMRASEIRELLKVLDRPDVISFAGGIPDPELFPKSAVRNAYGTALQDNEGCVQALQYSVSEGYLPLRQWIVSYMASQGVPCSTDNIVVTCGSQQALDFLGKLFLSAKDTVLVRAPTYLGALQAFNAYEPHYATLPGEGGNYTPEAYTKDTSRAGGRVGFAYVVPDFANPTGETMSQAARRSLLDLADGLDTAVIEDAAYRDLRFEGAAQPSLLALDIERNGSIEATRTIYCGTFSKTLAPGLRVGWMCAARVLVEKLVLAKQAADLHSATINQMVVDRVARAAFDSQVEKVRRVYRGRRDIMLKALAKYMPDGVNWSKPQGGMFVWLTLPDGMNGADLLRRSIAESGVAFVPGEAFFTDGTGGNTIRLSYSLASPDQIEQGIGHLGALIRDQAPTS